MFYGPRHAFIFGGCLETCYQPRWFDVGGHQCLTETNRRTQRRLLWWEKGLDLKLFFRAEIQPTRVNRWRNPVAQKKSEWTQEALADSILSKPRRPIIKGSTTTTLTTACQARYFTDVDSVVSFFSDSIYHVFYPVGFRCEVRRFGVLGDRMRLLQVFWSIVSNDVTMIIVRLLGGGFKSVLCSSRKLGNGPIWREIYIYIMKMVYIYVEILSILIIHAMAGS